MSRTSFKTTRRAAGRHQRKPFLPEFPLTSLVFEGGNYYGQQWYAHLNHSMDGSFPGKSYFLREITQNEISSQAFEYELQLNGVFSTATGLFCDSKKKSSANDKDTTEKKERKYFWSENLLFLKKKEKSDQSLIGDEVENTAVVFQLCHCKACKKKAGIPLRSLQPLRVEMCFSVSQFSNDPPRFVNIPVILRPALFSSSQDETPKSKLSKTGLISPQNLRYFAELELDSSTKPSPIGELKLSQIIFDEMAAKLVQICETELVDWSAYEQELEMKRNAPDVIPESPPHHQTDSPSLNDEPLFRSTPFSGISNLSCSVSPPVESPIKDKEEESGALSNFEDSRLLECLKYLNCRNGEVVPVKRPTLCLKTMLEEEINTDWEIISTDGKVVKCHLAVLATQVPFFRSISTCGNNYFAMPADTDMDEISVKAFLRFIYTQDSEMMKNSFQVCFTLLRAGHWHQLSSLVTVCSEIILKRARRLNHLEWFTVDGLWKLFEFVRNWEPGYPKKIELTNATVDILKLLLLKVNKRSGLLKITKGDEMLADLISGFLSR